MITIFSQSQYWQRLAGCFKKPAVFPPSLFWFWMCLLSINKGESVCAVISCVLFPGVPLIATFLRVLQYHSECRDDDTSTGSTNDEQLQILAEITAEFLADICSQISKVMLPKEQRSFSYWITWFTVKCSQSRTFPQKLLFVPLRTMWQIW